MHRKYQDIAHGCRGNNTCLMIWDEYNNKEFAQILSGRNCKNRRKTVKLIADKVYDKILVNKETNQH